MFKRFTYLFIYLFIYLSSKSQINLVPNSSFENIYSCFVGMGVINDTINGNNYVKNWCTAPYMTPEYNNVCANTIPFQSYPGPSSVPLNCVGYQYPRTGSAYVSASLCTYTGLPDSSKINTELVIVRLKEPLKQNHCYYGEFYYNLANRSKLIINHLGMYLANSAVTFTIPNSYGNNIVPQISIDTTQFISTDTVNWIKVSGTFIAQGGEEVLHIGNFKDGKHIKFQNINSNFVPTCMTDPIICFVHLDDVALYEIPSPQLQTNAITICPNTDSLVLGDTARIQSHYQWFANGVAIDTTSFIKVKPTQTTTYVLQTTQCGINTQSIVVTYSNNCEPVVVVEPIIPNVFTPNNDSINDVWRFSLGKGNTLKDISIVNRWGNLLYQKTNNLSQTTVLWDGRTTSGEETPNGVYFYVFQYTDANGDEHKKNGYITLIK
jgi:gliding motility-associated-like protein